MTAERILQSDVLDILFEDRNKLYGAYELRRTYPQRIKRAVGGMFFLIAAACTLYLYGSSGNTSPNTILEFIDSTTLVDFPPPDEPKDPEPPKSAALPDVATVKDFIPVIKPDEQVPETEVPPVEQVDSSAYGDKNQSGNPVADGQNITNGEPNASGDDGNNNKPVAAPEPVMPNGPIDMYQADEKPEYPGGTQALVRYMVNNLTSELEPGVKYVLKAQFVIDEAGQVSEAAILSSDDASLNNQVLKALRKMKQWKPGKFHGRNVAVRFTMPVTFVGPEE